jgi:hypothetical protein
MAFEGLAEQIAECNLKKYVAVKGYRRRFEGNTARSKDGSLGADVKLQSCQRFYCQNQRTGMGQEVHASLTPGQFYY